MEGPPGSMPQPSVLVPTAPQLQQAFSSLTQMFEALPGPPQPSAEQRLRHLEASNQALTEELARVHASLASTQEIVSSTQRELSHCRGLNRDLQNTVKQQDKHIKSLDQFVGKMMQHLNGLSHGMAQFETRVVSAHHQLSERVTHQIDQQTAQIDNVQNRIVYPFFSAMQQMIVGGSSMTQSHAVEPSPQEENPEDLPQLAEQIVAEASATDPGRANSAPAVGRVRESSHDSNTPLADACKRRSTDTPVSRSVPQSAEPDSITCSAQPPAGQSSEATAQSSAAMQSPLAIAPPLVGQPVGPTPSAASASMPRRVVRVASAPLPILPRPFPSLSQPITTHHAPSGSTPQVARAASLSLPVPAPVNSTTPTPIVQGGPICTNESPPMKRKRTPSVEWVKTQMPKAAKAQLNASARTAPKLPNDAQGSQGWEASTTTQETPSVLASAPPATRRLVVPEGPERRAGATAVSGVTTGSPVPIVLPVPNRPSVPPSKTSPPQAGAFSSTNGTLSQQNTAGKSSLTASSSGRVLLEPVSQKACALPTVVSVDSHLSASRPSLVSLSEQPQASRSQPLKSTLRDLTPSFQNQPPQALIARDGAVVSTTRTTPPDWHPLSEAARAKAAYASMISKAPQAAPREGSRVTARILSTVDAPATSTVISPAQSTKVKVEPDHSEADLKVEQRTQSAVPVDTASSTSTRQTSQQAPQPGPPPNVPLSLQHRGQREEVGNAAQRAPAAAEPVSQTTPQVPVKKQPSTTKNASVAVQPTVARDELMPAAADPELKQAATSREERAAGQASQQCMRESLPSTASNSLTLKSKTNISTSKAKEPSSKRQPPHHSSREKGVRSLPERPRAEPERPERPERPPLSERVNQAESRPRHEGGIRISGRAEEAGRAARQTHVEQLADLFCPVSKDEYLDPVYIWAWLGRHKDWAGNPYDRTPVVIATSRIVTENFVSERLAEELILRGSATRVTQGETDWLQLNMSWIFDTGKQYAVPGAGSRFRATQCFFLIVPTAYMSNGICLGQDGLDRYNLELVPRKAHTRSYLGVHGQIGSGIWVNAFPKDFHQWFAAKPFARLCRLAEEAMARKDGPRNGAYHYDGTGRTRIEQADTWPIRRPRTPPLVERLHGTIDELASSSRAAYVNTSRSYSTDRVSGESRGMSSRAGAVEAGSFSTASPHRVNRTDTSPPWNPSGTPRQREGAAITTRRTDATASGDVSVLDSGSPLSELSATGDNDTVEMAADEDDEMDELVDE